MATKEPTPEPTSKNVEKVLRDLAYSGYELYQEELEAAKKAYDERYAKLHQDPQLMALEKRKNAAYDKQRKAQKAMRTRAEAVLRMFQAEGLTPRVKKRVIKLVEEADIP